MKRYFFSVFFLFNVLHGTEYPLGRYDFFSINLAHCTYERFGRRPRQSVNNSFVQTLATPPPNKLQLE